MQYTDAPTTHQFRINSKNKQIKCAVILQALPCWHSHSGNILKVKVTEQKIVLFHALVEGVLIF
jgi:hypothetical protein